MTSFKLFGAVVLLVAIVAPASAQQAISEPAAAAFNPNFSIYSSGGDTSSRPMRAQPFNGNAMAEMRMTVRPHATHRAPTRHY
jgi:parvulin-like peptidyl-prolyl isomerase